MDFAAYDGTDGRRAAEVLGGRVSHYVVISTGQVYLVRQGCPRPAREGDYDGPLMPEPTDAFDKGQWDYGVKKRALEDALAEAWSTSRFPATRLRIPMVSGERDHFRRLERYLWRMLDGGPVLLPDGGDRVDAPRLLGVGGEGDPRAPGPPGDVRAGLQPRPGRDADAA